MFNLGIHGSHNASVAVSCDDNVLEVVEIERLVGKKNASLYFYDRPKNAAEILCVIQSYFSEKYNVSYYENIITNCLNVDEIKEFDEIFEYGQIKTCAHHKAHASCAFYQSPYDNALIISFDGGSDERFFNIYLADDRKSELKKLYSGNIDYATAYSACGNFIPAIKKENIFWGNLVYPGKLMGYSAYGRPREEYIEKFREFYLEQNTDDIEFANRNFGKKFGVGYFERIVNDEVVTEETFSSDGPGFLHEDDARDIAASNQYVFEELFYEEIKPFLDTYHDYPVVLAGGCALNILNNTKIAKIREDVFIPPNTNDSGIALGCLLSEIKPSEPVDATYLGPEVWDKLQLSKYLFNDGDAYLTNPYDIAAKICDGSIIGIVRGRSELGPRALGNRSLLAAAHIPGSNSVMNLRVKNRESFRPFSPIVRLEDVDKFFVWDRESRHMTFSVKVKKKYRRILSSITHIDGTARIQTITRNQNKFIYDILTELNRLCGVGVVLNTSFNVAGKPILNTYREAFKVLNSKPINGIVLGDYYFESKTIGDVSPMYYPSDGNGVIQNFIG